jgi:hypothetical protein
MIYYDIDLSDILPVLVFADEPKPLAQVTPDMPFTASQQLAIAQGTMTL